MPSGDNQWYLDDPDGIAMFGNYSQFIGKELVQFTRDTFPLSDKREDTFIAGLSMGGLGAVINGLRWNETFSHIGALSPGLMLGDYLDGYDYERYESIEGMAGSEYSKMLERILGDRKKVYGSYIDYKGAIKSLKASGANIPKTYIACGESDFILERSRDYHRFLQEESIEHTYKEAPGGHDWTFWDTHIKEFIEQLPLDETAVSGKHSGNVYAG